MFTKRVIAAVVGLGLLGALAAGVLLNAGAAGAAPAAQTATGAVAWAAGKITALQTSGFSVTAPNQHVTTVTVGSNTWIVVKQNNAPAQGAFTDLKVGDTVFVSGVARGTDQIAARVVSDGVGGRFLGRAGKPNPPKAGKPGKAARASGEGTIQSVSNGTLTLTAGKNNARTLTVNTDAGTIVIKNGLASVGDLKAGDVVHIVPRRPAAQPGATKPAPGTTPANRPTPTAAVIYVPSADHTLVPAQVKAVSGNTLTLNGKARTVNVDANTAYKLVGAAGQAPAAASLSDLKAGARVLIYAAKPAQGQTATASVVLILPAAQKPSTPAGSGL